MIEKTQHMQHRTGQCKNLFQQAGRLIVLMALLIGSATFGSRAALAQLTTADILGTVTDSTGAVVPKANITLVNVDTNLQRTGVSNDSGDFDFTLLPVGHYSVTVKISGFKTGTVSNISVEAGDRARADVHLETGGATETVTVEAQTPLLQADSATVSSTVTAKAVQDLPLNGRNLVQLVDLVPGANEGAGNGLGSGGRPDDRRSNANGLSVNGQDEALNNWIVDGLDDNERIIGTIGVKPNVEGIQEITIQTNSYAAEAGRTAGGVINIVTKAGTNKFHGSAYEYFRNDIFDGRNVFQTTGNKPELRQNQYGASIGGPIFKNRTFFYFDYEGFRQVSGTTVTGTVPTLAEWDDINSQNGGTPQALFSNTNGTLEAYNGTLPGAGGPVAINPIMLNYLKLFPAPTNTSPTALSGNFTISPNKTQNSNTYDARVDHKFNDRNLFFARFAYSSVDTVTPPNFGTVNGIQVSGGRYNFDGPATDIAQQYSLGYTHIFTSNLLLDLRAGFTRINNLSLPLNYGKNIDQSIGFPASMTSFSPFANSLTPVSIGPFGDIGDGAYVPLQDIDNTFQYSGTLSWTKGNHDIKVGLALVRRQARNVQSASAAGFYQFNTSADNLIPVADQGDPTKKQTDIQSNQLASSLLGAFGSQTRDFNISAPDYRSWEPGGFVQDSWKATAKLTVLAGVRYDVFTPFTEAHNHISNFDFPEALTLSAANIDDALKVAGVNGVNSQVNIPTDYSNVAPRLGFAYSMTPTLVLRGGYGLSFFPGNYTSNADLKNAPFNSAYGPSCQSSLSVLLENSVGASAGQQPDCVTIGAPGAISSTEAIPAPPTTPQAVPPLASITGLTFVAEAPKLKSALIQQFNLQLEQQFAANVFTIGYVGSIGQHLPESIDNINQPKPFNPLTNPNGATRPLGVVLPNLSGVSYIQSEGISNYNGLQTSFQRRFTHGLAFDANYTWAKALADISSFSQQGDQGWSHADPTRIRQIEYGKSDTDIQNRFALALNYELQYGKEFSGIKKAVFAGWETNIITAWQSGKVFSIVNSGSNADNPEGLGFNNRACPQNCNGPDRPSQIGDARLAHKTLTKFFNTAAFVPQPLGTVGNVQRNSLFGPDFRHVDLSLFKNFPIKELFNVQFRVETFNISNTPNFYIRNNGQPEQQFGNAGFGTITQTDPNYNPREFQFALKLQF